MSSAQLIKLADQRRFILQRQEQNLVLFIYSCTVAENDKQVEYWKCAHRACSVRICCHGSWFWLVSEFSIHPHNSHSFADTLSFLWRNRYLVEKNLFQRPSLPAFYYSSAASRQVTIIEDDKQADSDGTVLKQLLLSRAVAGKQAENVESAHSRKIRQRYSPLIPLVKAKESGRSSNNGFKTEEKKASMEVAVDGEFNESITQQNMSDDADSGCWSPPILTPPPAGRPYSPPLTPVAYIGPYVEPRVKYNPYFLWQLYSYKQSCSNYLSSPGVIRT